PLIGRLTLLRRFLSCSWGSHGLKAAAPEAPAPSGLVGKRKPGKPRRKFDRHTPAATVPEPHCDDFRPAGAGVSRAARFSPWLPHFSPTFTCRLAACRKTLRVFNSLLDVPGASASNQRDDEGHQRRADDRPQNGDGLITDVQAERLGRMQPRGERT